MRYIGLRFKIIACLIGVSYAQLHFASLGNWGSGSSGQYTVANTLKLKAKSHTISFIISPGSNFIDGVNSLNDTRWSNAFEKPYSGPELQIPFYSVLGSQDWSANATAQLLRTNLGYSGGVEDEMLPGPKWTIPNWWFHYSQHFSDASASNVAYGSIGGSVGFVFIDTYVMSETFPYQDVTKKQWDALRDTIEASVRVFDWVIVVGDKAILSSGSSKGDSYLSDTLRQLLKDYKVDAYISGNDFNMEMIEDGPLLHINCGTGSGTDPLVRIKAENSVAYAAKIGFCYHTLTKRHMSTEFIDGYTGDVISNFTKSRNIRDRSMLDRFHLYSGLPEIKFLPIAEVTTVAATKDDLFLQICGTVGILITLGSHLALFSILGHRFFKST